MASVFKDLQDQEQRLHDLESEMSDPAVIADTEKLAKVSDAYDQLQTDFKARNGYGYRAEIRGVLHGFEFGETDYDRPVTELSGGQKKPS